MLCGLVIGSECVLLCVCQLQWPGFRYHSKCIIPNAGALDPLSFVVVLGVSIHGSLSRLGGVTDDLVVCMAMYV